MKSLIVLFVVYYVVSSLFKKLTKQAARPDRSPEPAPVPDETGMEPVETPSPSPFNTSPALKPGPESLFSLLGMEPPQPVPVRPEPPLPATEPFVYDELVDETAPVSEPEKEIPVPAAAEKSSPRLPRLRITAGTARQGIVLAEILGPCKAMRSDSAGV